jgi:hypothetical protein
MMMQNPIILGTHQGWNVAGGDRCKHCGMVDTDRFKVRERPLVVVHLLFDMVFES